MTDTMDPDARDTLEFWFGAIAEDGFTRDDRLRLWFGKDDAQDAEIASRFREQTGQALNGALEHWSRTPACRLALIITLDQFTRNIFRGTADAFAGDDSALEHTQMALALGEDRELPLIQRVFLYLPLEHAESLEMQNESVRRFEQLATIAPPEHSAAFRSFLAYAESHRDVIRQFGRFPHRNAILGRSSTPDERIYLDAPGAGF